MAITIVITFTISIAYYGNLIVIVILSPLRLYCGQTITFDCGRPASRQTLQAHFFPRGPTFRRFFAGSADSASWNLNCAAWRASASSNIRDNFLTRAVALVSTVLYG